jgi:hypothetical protein
MTTGTISATQPENAVLLLQLARECEEILEVTGRGAAKGWARGRLTRSTLMLGLRSSEAVVRAKVLYLLLAWAPDDLFEICANVLCSDASAVVRHEAAYLLGTLEDRRAVDVLARALSRDPEALVRHEAAEALGELGFQEALPSLRAAVSDEASAVAETAALSLRQIELAPRSMHSPAI